MSFSLRVGSYNILNPDFAASMKTKEGIRKDGSSNWASRKNIIVKNLVQGDFDLVCLQELSQSALDSMSKVLQKNKLRFAGKLSPDCSGLGILYNSSRLQLLHPLPGDPADKSHEGGHQQFATFKHRETGKVIRIANVHFQGYNLSNPQCPKRILGYAQMKSTLENLKTNLQTIDGVVIAGDFNEVMTFRGDALSRRNLLLRYNFHYNNRDSKIDWFAFRSTNPSLSKVTFERMDLEQEKASDHDLIGGEIHFPTPFSLENSLSIEKRKNELMTSENGKSSSNKSAVKSTKGNKRHCSYC